MDDFKTRPPSGAAAIPSQVYRDAMSRFAGAVNVVTTEGPAGRRGVTVSAAVSISDDPPTVLICLNHNRAENRMFAENGCFAVNVLSGSDVELARAFAGEGRLEMEERFAHGEWHTLETGSPVLAGARASLDCVVVDVQSVHTHDIIFGRVIAVGEENDGEALVYLDRQYRSV
ncbi:MAG: flavin reductase [Nitratireductor sp.]|nr:flavin reductase [Nitratireductor sp.]